MLSTCNRTEIYARAHALPPGGRRRQHVPRRATPAPTPDDFAELPLHVLRRRRGRAPVLGRRRPRLDDRRRERDPRPGPRGVAGADARRHRRPAAVAGLFRHAVESGKRVRTETGIGRHAVSIPSAAVAVAAEHLGSLRRPSRCSWSAPAADGDRASRRRCAGAGRRARSWSPNRTRSPVAGGRRAGRGRGDPARRDRRRRSSTPTCCSRRPASPQVLIERATIEMVMACRGGRPLLVVDVAVPRDVDPGVRRGERRHAARPRRPQGLRRAALGRAPAREIGKVREIIAAEIERLPRSSAPAARSRRSSPSLRDLGRRRAQAAELDRFRGRLAAPRPRRPRAGRGDSPGHRQQAAARADRAGEGRRRLGPRGDYYADALADLFASTTPE